MPAPGMAYFMINRRASAYILSHPLAFVLQVLKGFRANQGLLLAGAVAYYSLFFSSLAFTVLENAMSVIFVHRVAIRRRHFLISAVLPYCYILCLGVGILLITVVAGGLQVMSEESVRFLRHDWGLEGVSGVLLYLLGLAGEILVLSSIYLVMPVGRLSLTHALIGGVTAALLWEIARHVLVWYFSTLSQVNVVYGSMTTAIVVMFSLEIGATLLLLGAQVISEYERVARGGEEDKPLALRT